MNLTNICYKVTDTYAVVMDIPSKVTIIHREVKVKKTPASVSGIPGVAPSFHLTNLRRNPGILQTGG
ncbi:outer membrane receptor proteins, mostly Fe transport [Bacillus sp. OxB-1]|nr:outer membrane receptor proteins, mostly Fe transport [Bacillus sp. OxB-1]